MKARPFQVFLLIIASFFIASLLPHRGAAQEANDAKGTLRGQVTDPSGATVAGATILLTTPAGASINTTTNKDGSYEFKNLVPGKYTVKAVAQGFALFTQENVVIAAGQVQKVNVALTIEVQEQKAVSYTHLDVYKRQPRRWTNLKSRV